MIRLALEIRAESDCVRYVLPQDQINQLRFVLYEPLLYKHYLFEDHPLQERMHSDYFNSSADIIQQGVTSISLWINLLRLSS